MFESLIRRVVFTDVMLIEVAGAVLVIAVGAGPLIVLVTLVLDHLYAFRHLCNDFNLAFVHLNVPPVAPFPQLA